jgi:hypothetical protein
MHNQKLNKARDLLKTIHAERARQGQATAPRTGLENLATGDLVQLLRALLAQARQQGAHGHLSDRELRHLEEVLNDFDPFRNWLTPFPPHEKEENSP